MNNLVKVANHSGYSSLGRCLSKALLESGKKLTGRLPVTLMLAYNVPRYFQLLPPPRRFLVTSTPILVETALNGEKGGGRGGRDSPCAKKMNTIFLFGMGSKRRLHKSFEFFRREIFVLEFDEEKYHLNSTKKV